MQALSLHGTWPVLECMSHSSPPLIRRYMLMMMLMEFLPLSWPRTSWSLDLNWLRYNKQIEATVIQKTRRRRRRFLHNEPMRTI